MTKRLAGRDAKRPSDATGPVVTGPVVTGRSGPDRSVVVLSVATMVATFALVVLGSTVRVTDSGMGCPSWPLCFGRIGPVDQFHALLEQSHRYLVALVTAGAFTTAVLARRSRVRSAAFAPAAVAAGLVLVQAALGALTVFAKNAPWTVAVHLVVGVVFLGATAVTVVAALGARRVAWSVRAVGRSGGMLLVATLATVVGGSLVVAHGAGGSCPSWPLCPSSATALADWQLAHRSLAGLTGVGLVVFAGANWRRTSGWSSWRSGAIASLGAYVVVAALGAASALSRAAASWQDAHLALVAVLWVLVVATVSALAAERTGDGTDVPERSGP
ncbi:MAG: COX15/CtaA family protein [Actinomycetota bacterium]|nr:COX15/CtaA family protein [Actinomycetota bacterium]